MDTDTICEKLKSFLSDGLLTAFPKKHKMKVLCLMFLAEKFEYDKVYSEAEVNGIINASCTFSDQATLRRALCDYGFITRDAYGHEYKKLPSPIFPSFGREVFS